MSKSSGWQAALVAVVAIVGGLIVAGCSDSSAEQSVLGEWGPGGPGQPELVLDADGRLSGSDGCNRLMGSWSETGGEIELSEMVSTRMACLEEVDTWLSGAARLQVDGETMHVLDKGGVEIGTLERQAERN